MEKRRKVERMLISGDLNVKTGADGEIVKERMSGKEEGKIRRSKGGKVN